MHPLTHSCFLPPLLGRLFLCALPFLLGICPPSPWSPPFPLHALAVIPLSCQGAAHLDSLLPHDLVLWTDGFVPFPFGKRGSGVLANCSLCGTEDTLSFLAGPVCSSLLLKPAPFCTLFADLGSANKSAISLLLLSDSRSVLATLSSPPSILLSQTLWQMWQELSSLFSCSIRLQWIPEHSFLAENKAADELARWRALLVPSAIHSSLSHFIFHTVSSFFLDWRCTVSLKFFNTQVSSISTKELVLPCHARCVLSRLHCNGHSLFLDYLSRIGRIENPSFSACGHLSQNISHLILHCPATDSLCRLLFGDSLFL